MSFIYKEFLINVTWMNFCLHVTDYQPTFHFVCVLVHLHFRRYNKVGRIITTQFLAQLTKQKSSQPQNLKWDDRRLTYRILHILFRRCFHAYSFKDVFVLFHSTGITIKRKRWRFGTRYYIKLGYRFGYLFRSEWTFTRLIFPSII